MTRFHLYSYGATASVVALLVGAFAATAQAVPITLPVKSTFDIDLDGWTTNRPADILPSSTEGNPGGFAKHVDHDVPNQTIAWLIAPAKFLGDWSNLNGVGSILFDQKIIQFGTVGSGGVFPYRIDISGPGGAFHWTGPTPSNSEPWLSWVEFDVPIEESSWTFESGTWGGLLANVTDFQIQIELVGSGAPPLDIEGIDNVALVPEPSTAWLLTLGLVMLAARRSTLRKAKRPGAHNPRNT